MWVLIENTVAQRHLLFYQLIFFYLFIRNKKSIFPINFLKEMCENTFRFKIIRGNIRY